jgi:hypothetical protein
VLARDEYRLPYTGMPLMHRLDVTRVNPIANSGLFRKNRRASRPSPQQPADNLLTPNWRSDLRP